MEDKEIIENVLQGKTQYFEILIKKYEKMVFHIILHLLKEKCLYKTEEIAQDVFLIIYKKLRQYNPKYELRNWIYTITLNKTRSFLRKENIRQKLFGFFKSEPVLDSNVEKIIYQNEVKHLLDKEIKQLPENYQKVLLFFYSEELTIKQISEVMKQNENTIKTWLFRAKDILKENEKLKNIFETFSKDT